MKGNNSYRSDYAVNEVVGGLILVVIAVVAFSAIYPYLIPDLDPIDKSVEFRGFVKQDGTAVLEHVGGISLSSYKIVIRDVNGTFIDSSTYTQKWSIGGYIYPLEEIGYGPLINESDQVGIVVYVQKPDGKEQQVFNGILCGITLSASPPRDRSDDMLITSLRTDSVDEDLICFTEKVNSSLNVTSYIYKWLVNGESFAQILMPFDVEDTSTAKDYSGNEYHGDVHGADWSENGIKGGAYYFDGAGDYIDMDLPGFFTDISRNDFTISVWINSSDIGDNKNVVFEVCDNYPAYKNYIRIFQYDNKIHLAVLETNVMHGVKTVNLTSNSWYHITGVWDASDKYLAIYLDGVKSLEIGERNLSLGAQDGLTIGHGSASTPNWYGYIDELQIFDKILSDEQIYYIYLSQKYTPYNLSLIASQETIIGETWQCVIIPTDGIQEDTPWESNTLEIISYGGGG